MKFSLLSCFFLSFSVLLQSQTLERELLIGYAESPPFIYTNQNDELDGISIWLWQRIADELNLKFKLQQMPLDQIINGLEKNTIDLSINPLTITADRSQIMDFSQPFYVSHSSIVIQQSSAWQKSFQFVLSFFSLNFFKSIIALFMIILIFGFLVWLLEKKNNAEHFEPGIKGIWSGVWWSAVTMTTVGYGDKAPKTLGGRIISLIWMFTAIIIISGFTASIASSLTINQLGWNQNKIEDFKDKKIASVDKSATLAWLEKRFYKKRKHFSELNQALLAVKNNQVDAVAYDEPILKYTLINDSTFNSLEVLPIKFNPQFYAMGFTFSFDKELRRKISKKIIEISEQSDWNLLLAEYNLNEF